MFDFKDQSLEQVIDKALIMDKMQTSNSMSMASLQRSLLTREELNFRQAIQCTKCLNLGHSTMECTLHTHCSIHHSKAHTIEQCKYNLLNKVMTSVQQTHDGRQYDRNRQVHRFCDDDWPRYDDRYRSDLTQ